MVSPECARCFRSAAEHELFLDGQADEIRRRIWRALGQPCASFAGTLAEAARQAISARPARPARPAAANPEAAATAGRGAALARQLLERRAATR